MSNRRVLRLTIILITGLLAGSSAAQHYDMPPGMTHEQHQAQMKREAEMKKRGNGAMGFDQDKTTHHFFLTSNGGVIQVESNASTDTVSRDQIRSHLKKIAEQFAKGDFQAPLATHNEMPTGAESMQKLKSKIAYSYEERPNGAAVRITSSDGSAVEAVHDFLRYQIREHATGDPLEVVNSR
ncbi:MAG TPA: hypothetical protein VF493_11375 [Terriglobales bacterium]